MSFRDDRQIARVCIALLQVTRQAEALWTEDGPTDLALDYRANGVPFGSGGQALFKLAFVLWNGAGGVSIAELIASLDPERLLQVGELIGSIALGPAAIDAWLARRAGEA